VNVFIKSIHLENVLSHEDTTLALDKLTAIRGANGGGKSTIVAATQALMTGLCDFTDARGAGIQDLIRGGADKAVITADIEDSGDLRTLRASITEKSGRMPTCTKAGNPNRDYLDYLAANKDVLSCLINSRSFFAKKPDDQKEMLAGIILPNSYTFEKWALDGLSTCGLNVDRSKKPMDLITDAYDAAYNERKAVNRSIKDWREPEKPAAPQTPVADIRARLKDRQDARTTAALKKQKAFSAWEKADDERGKYASKILLIESKLRTEHERREQIAKDLLSKTALKEHESIAKNSAKATELDAQIQSNLAELRVQRKARDAFDSIVDSGRCPTCLRELSDDVATTIGSSLIQRIDELDMRDRQLQQQRKELGDFAGAQKNLDAHIAAEKNVKIVDEHIADYEKQLRELKNQTEQPTAKPDTSQIDTEIADLDARIEKGNAALQEAVRAQTLSEQYETAIATKKTMDERQALLDKLCDYFGPKGVMAELLDKSVGPFQSSMNAILAGWGFECRLQFEPHAFDVRFAGKDRWYPLKTMSESQKLMFIAGFKVALAKVTGFNFVWIDEADTFLDANRSLLYKNLMSAGLDQIVVLQSDTRREIPKAPNSSFYMLSLDTSGGIPKTIAERLPLTNHNGYSNGALVVEGK
jgi:hypothetical protein